MKILSLFIALLFSGLSVAQDTESSSTRIGKFGTIEIKFVSSKSNGRVVNFFYLGFQNREYQHIIDIGSIGLHSLEIFDLFISSCESAIEKSKGKTSASWKIDNESKVQVYDFTSSIYFYSDEKYTYISAKKVQKMIDALKMERSRLE